MTTTTMKPSEVLRAAKALIDTPDKWWQDGGHNSGNYTHNCTCADLAIDHAAPNYGVSQLAEDIFVRANRISTNGRLNSTAVYSWNDAPERTHAEVMEAFSRAIALAEAEESANA